MEFLGSSDFSDWLPCEARTDTKLRWQKLIQHLVSPSYGRDESVFISCFFYIIISRQTKTWFYMCREALYTVLCNTLLQKKKISVGKVGALKKNVFSSLRVLLPFFRWSELCQKNLILILFIYCMLSFPFCYSPSLIVRYVGCVKL